MTSKTNLWTKTELKIYILLLCADADAQITKVEMDLIKSKVDSKTFEKALKKFSNDSEYERFEQIDDNIQQHEFHNIELASFRQDVYEVFLSDRKLNMMEQNLNRILQNILY